MECGDERGFGDHDARIVRARAIPLKGIATLSALDERIQRQIEVAIRAERARNREMWAEIVIEIERRAAKKLGRADAGALEKVEADIRELFAREPDRNGVVRREYFSPRPR